jgi:oligopeptide transport system ATP-binding protein
MILNGKRLKNREKSIYKTQKNVYYELINDEKALKEDFKQFKKNYKSEIKFGVKDIENNYENKIKDLKNQTEFNIFDAKNQIKFNKLDIASAKKKLNEAQNEAERQSIESKMEEYSNNIENLKNDIVRFKEEFKDKKAKLKEQKANEIKEFIQTKKEERAAVNQRIAEVKNQYSDPQARKEKLAEVSELHRRQNEYEEKMAELESKIPEAKKAYLDAKKEAKQVVKKEWAEARAKAQEEIQKVKSERETVGSRDKEVEKAEKALSEVLEKKEQLKETYKKDLSEAVTTAEKNRIKKQYEFDMSEIKIQIKKAKEDVKIEKNYFKHKIAEIKENLNRFKKVTKQEAKERAIKIMQEVGIPQPEKRFRQYPFQFSGGMRQRIVIAIALTANPDVLICDEPTTALDVTIQAQILELINDLKVERNLSVIFITHDLGVVANMADRIGVMYAGKIVEIGTAEDIFYDPKHPYTWALLSSMPDINTKERLIAIPGTPPNMLFPPKGDAFADRNQYAMKIDFEKQPPMFKVSDTHKAATWLLHKDAPIVC